jgi:hypothetical protein
MNSANEKYGSSLDRTLGAGKPVDPATRLSELLAQSLEELTRPFDSTQAGEHPSAPAHSAAAAQPLSPEAAAHEMLPRDAPQEPSPEGPPIDADKALAELEAELFAAAQQVDREGATAPATEGDTTQQDPEPEPGTEDRQPEAGEAAPAPQEAETQPDDAAAPAIAAAAPLAPAEGETDADAARVIARVRKLMLVSMAVTVLAVGSVFGFIGYRIFKGDGMVEKKADKLPESSAIPNDITLSVPRGARVVQSAVANDRLLITLEIDGKLEVRTFDVKTLQPTGRLDFTATP